MLSFVTFDNNNNNNNNNNINNNNNNNINSYNNNIVFTKGYTKQVQTDKLVA